MNGKMIGVTAAALILGAVGGGLVSAKLAPESEAEAQTAAPVSEKAAPDATQKALAEARTEAEHWRAQTKKLEQQLALAQDEPAPVESTEDAPMTALEPAEPDREQMTKVLMDATMRQELEEYRERDREREERWDERRDEMENWREEMVSRRTNMFTELIERTGDTAEQQRWADIEKAMADSSALRRQMRDAETDEERELVRDAMRQNYETTQSLLKQQQNAVLTRELESQGVTNAAEQAKIIEAVHSSIDDTAFRMSGFGGWGGRGFGGDGRGRGR
jgi:hypothetical protein